MIIIAEKINGSIPSVAKAIAARDEAFLKDLAIRQSEAIGESEGFIDVCASVPPEVEFDTMRWMLDLVQSVTDTPISVDSPNAECLVELLPYVKRPGLVNSVSGEGNKIDLIFPLLAKPEYKDWQVMALLSDDTGIPKSAADRLRVFDKIMAKAKEYGIKPNRIHIDPLVEMLCTSENGLHEEADFAAIGRLIEGARRYFLQAFTDRDSVPFSGLTAPSRQEMERFAAAVSPFAETVQIRGMD